MYTTNTVNSKFQGKFRGFCRFNDPLATTNFKEFYNLINTSYTITAPSCLINKENLEM